MKKVKNFKIKSDKKPCYSCEKSFTELCSIKITTSDVSHRYTGSNRPWRSNYSLKLCPKCFKKFEKNIENIVIN